MPNPAAIANPGGLPGTNAIDPVVTVTTPSEPLSSAEWWTRAIVRTLALPIILAPGSLIAYWRLTRHRRRYRSRRAGEGFLALRRELRQARLIHESMLPHQDSKAHIPFTFKFVPASEIGGDFCDTVVSSDGSRSVIIVDVFGHGLAAALAVLLLSLPIVLRMGVVPTLLAFFAAVTMYLSVPERVVAAVLIGLLGFVPLLGGFVPIFTLIRLVKIAENATDYSLMNTTRHALFLPVDRDATYEGKTAIDSFFWRVGDLIQAGVVFTQGAATHPGAISFSDLLATAETPAVMRAFACSAG
jgi:hypothetical protein